MYGWDESEMLLAVLGPADRAKLDELVDVFIRDELPTPGPGCIAYAAEALEQRAAVLPAAKRLVVAQFAAALRERLGRERCH
jgi:hypothetical protein